jgi:hypothetical protein
MLILSKTTVSRQVQIKAMIKNIWIFFSIYFFKWSMNKSNKLGLNKLIIKTANRPKKHLHEEFNANPYISST